MTATSTRPSGPSFRRRYDRSSRRHIQEHRQPFLPLIEQLLPMNQNQSVDLALRDQPCRNGRLPKRRRGAEDSLVVDADLRDSLLLDRPKLTMEFHCQSVCPRTARPELRAGSCAPQEGPVPPSDIRAARQCAGGNPGRTRSRAAWHMSKAASPAPCRTPDSEMPPAGADDSAWPVADPSFLRREDSRGRSAPFRQWSLNRPLHPLS